MVEELVLNQMIHLKDLWRKVMKTKGGFEIEISSDLDYEEIVANILYEQEIVATVSQEKGLENLEIEIFMPVEGKPWKFSFEKFLDVLQVSKKNFTT